jgi:ParB family chromosome partitioning protein
MERRLGKGLGALLAADPAPMETRSEIPTARIHPNPHQPRKTFAPEVLSELQESIRTHGILQPVVVRPVPNGFELIAGERRWRAARALGLQAVPAVVREGVSDRAMLELALVENLQRADLDPLEKARGFRQLLEQGLTQEEVAERVGLKRSTVANFLRLLELPDAVQKMVTEGILSMGHARALLGLADRARLGELAALVVRRGLSVRDVELRVRELQSRSEPKVAPLASQAPWVREMETRIRTHLGAKVQVRNRV